MKSQLKSLLRSTFLGLPLPLSKFAYRLGSATIFRDVRSPYFSKIFKQASLTGRVGDYLEFGVYQGKSFVQAFQLAEQFDLAAMRFHAFDSFEGLPESEGSLFTQTQFASTEVLFRKVLIKSGVAMHRVLINRGFYSDTLNLDTQRKHGISSAAIVHIDCDLYSSTVEALRFIENMVYPGSILIFDDWYAFERHGQDDMGEQKAFREWKLYDRFEELYDLNPHSKSFIMVRA